jgi:DNA polymerase-3 subunit gamma/tau
MSDQQYLVTARKYRPAQFKELVAQEHVTETLKNAIRLDRLAHAYLFSGPRGVGKTTAARILAKAINCETPQEEREDEAEPCCECPSCESFEGGRNLNIFELDAASNNKVDDIRELREKVRVPPQGNKRKVYIIDEVHMLSNQAFNALLKTLEEPPEHVLFIFATTEPNKVLPTILSRCQRFDFRRIPTQKIVRQLRFICEEEGIAADDGSLMLIARKGNGALRDALSAFDQAVSLVGDELKRDELVQALGVVNVERYFETTTRVAEQDAAGMLRLIEHVAGAGHDLQEFVAGLAEHLRNLLVARSMDDTGLIDATETLRERYAEHAADFSEQDLLRFLTIADEVQDELRDSRQPRLKLEMALLKMTHLARAADLRDAIEKVERLEAMAREGELASLDEDAASTPQNEASQETQRTAPAGSGEPAPPSYDASSDSPEPAGAPTGEEPADSEPVVEEDEPEQKPASTESEAPSPRDEDDDAPPPEPPVSGEPAPPEPSPSREEPAQSESASSPEQGSYNDLFNTPALGGESGSASDENDGGDAPQSHHQGDGAAVAVATPPAFDETGESDQVQRVKADWPDFVQAVRQDRIHVGALLDHATPLGVQSDTLSVAVPDDFHQRLLRGQHAFLIGHFERIVTGELERLDFVVREEDAATPEQETASEMDPYEHMQKKREENPVIRAIFEKFGGELVW